MLPCSGRPLFRFFRGLQPLQNHFVASGAVAQLGVYPGDGGAAGGDLGADGLVGFALGEHLGHLEPLGKGGQLPQNHRADGSSGTENVDVIKAKIKVRKWFYSN